MNIETICVPHFNKNDAMAYIRSAFVIPTEAEMSAEMNPGLNSITVRIFHDGKCLAIFMCNPLRDWRKK